MEAGPDKGGRFCDRHKILASREAESAYKATSVFHVDTNSVRSFSRKGSFTSLQFRVSRSTISLDDLRSGNAIFVSSTVDKKAREKPARKSFDASDHDAGSTIVCVPTPRKQIISRV